MPFTPHTPCQVLVVEDDPSIGAMIEVLLELKGYVVATAVDGSAAVEYLREAPTLPKLILLDLWMSGMDGREFRAIQQANPDWSAIPVILMSASHDIAAVQQELDVQKIIHKPFDPPKLLELVDQFCR